MQSIWVRVEEDVEETFYCHNSVDVFLVRARMVRYCISKHLAA